MPTTKKELLDVLADLHTQCCMIHRHWGEGCNQVQADRAVQRSRDILTQAGYTVPK